MPDQSEAPIVRPITERLLEMVPTGATYADGSASLGSDGSFESKPATPIMRRANRDGPEAAEIIRLCEEALEKLNICGSCGGSGRYPDKGWRNGVFTTREVDCKKCGGTGENPIASAVIAQIKGQNP